VNSALPGRDVTGLASDVGQLVMIFTKLVETDQVHVRLECLEDNGCSFWHQDNVPFVLSPPIEVLAPNLSIQISATKLSSSGSMTLRIAQSLTLQDVAFFKGRLFADTVSSDDNREDTVSTSSDDDLFNQPVIVHRSPRIEGSGVVRVVLVLDIPAEFHDDEDDAEGVAEVGRWEAIGDKV
jgi:Protein of unknown function (DUF1826)